MSGEYEQKDMCNDNRVDLAESRQNGERKTRLFATSRETSESPLGYQKLSTFGRIGTRSLVDVSRVRSRIPTTFIKKTGGLGVSR